MNKTWPNHAASPRESASRKYFSNIADLESISVTSPANKDDKKHAIKQGFVWAGELFHFEHLYVKWHVVGMA